jgi:hypothetical protein
MEGSIVVFQYIKITLSSRVISRFRGNLPKQKRVRIVAVELELVVSAACINRYITK